MTHETILNGPVMASDSRKYVSNGPTVLFVPFAQVHVLTTMTYFFTAGI